MDFNEYIKTYEDLARQVGGMVLANEIAKRPLEHQVPEYLTMKTVQRIENTTFCLSPIF